MDDNSSQAFVRFWQRILWPCDNAAGEACPVWPGNPMTAHWGVPDPADATGTDAQIGQAFADAYRMLNQRIGIFAALPIAKLDALTLHKHVINRWSEIAGLRLGALEGADFDAMFHVTPASIEFGRIAGRDGVRSALSWRDQPFGNP